MSAPLLTALGRTSLSAAVMILAVLVLRIRFQERTPRRVFCLLWDLVLVRLLVLTDITSPLSIQRLLAGLRAGERHTTVQEAVPQVTLADGGVLFYSNGAVYGTAVAEDRALAAGTAAFTLDWAAILTAAWLAGALLGGLWLLWRHQRSRKLYADSLPVRSAAVTDWQAMHPLRRPVQVRHSDRIASPLTYGVLYPVVLLPAGMDLADGEVLSCVLSHEYTHIRRFDTLRKGLLALALCLHWFDPLVWVMYVLANRDIELACDEAVVRAGADRRSYALALLQLEERRGYLSGSFFSRNALEERIGSIMKLKKFSATAIIAVLVAMSIATTVFATGAPESEPEERAEPVIPVTTAVTGGSRQAGLVDITEDTATKDVISRLDENGNTVYSVDGGKTWMSEDRYRAEYCGGWGSDWTVEWWTAEEYAEWLEQEKKELQDMIGERGYNPTDGWFTWDQQKVDETIALYESILEDIKNGALHSKTIVDKDGNTIDDVALGSDGVLFAQYFDFSSDELVEFKPENVEQQREDLLQECAPFGLTGSEKDGLFYNGQSVRAFVDGYGVADNGYAVRYAYYDENGTVDVHTVRTYVRWADGSYDPSGDLIALVTKGNENFDQGLVDCALPSTGVQSTLAEGNTFTAGNDRFDEIQLGILDSDGYKSTPISDEEIPSYMKDLLEATSTGDFAEWYQNSASGRTFEEIFAQYEAYGLDCQSGEGSFVDLTYNGQPVRSFADLKPDGSTFTYQNPFTAEGLSLRAVYDENGDLTGLCPEQDII